jgi:hypothetical protein
MPIEDNDLGGDQPPLRFCEHCGRRIGPGQLAYQATIELVSTYDGYAAEADSDGEADEAEADAELERLLAAVMRQDPQEVADDVAQVISLTICRRCRNELVKTYGPRQRIVH